MQRNQFLSLLRALALGALCLYSINLQAQTRVLASGHPPLTSEMADKMVIFFEWALDVQFTPAQTQDYQNLLISDWSDSAKRKSTLDVLQMLNNVAALPPETRSRIQAEVRRTLVDGMHKENQDAETRWIQAIYDAAHPTEARVESVADARGAAPDGRLTGKWNSSTASSVQYRNSYTGTMAPTSGHSFFYEFRSDGTYRNYGVLQMTTYGCTSSIYRDNSGHYRVEGDHLYIEPSQGIVKSQVCGGQQTEKPDKLDADAYVFHFESSAGVDVLVMNSVGSKARPDYFRREK